MKRTAGPGKKKMDGKGSVYSSREGSRLPWQGKIERLVWGGMGLGHAEDGRTILVSAPLALFPGEVVEAQVHWKARHGEGSVERWVRPDRRRVKAACPVAGTCGGCDLWEAGPEAGELKRLMVEDLFARALPACPAWRWREAPAEARRHRIQLHWDGSALGFHRRRSHQVVPVSACPAAVDALSAAIPRLAEALRERVLPTRAQRWELATGTPPGEVVATLETGRAWRLEPDGWHAWEGPVTHRHEGFTLSHAPGGFYQVSPEWAATAFGELLAEWDLRGDTLYDLYGGVGFFSALLGNRFRRRVLVESGEEAVACAKANLEALGLEAECLAADAAAWVPESLGQPGDVLLLDPPRAGLAPELSAKLQASGADTLVLVGCDGAAFCRDLKRLEPAWSLEALAALDLFPLTHHVECVALMRKLRAS